MLVMFWLMGVKMPEATKSTMGVNWSAAYDGWQRADPHLARETAATVIDQALQAARDEERAAVVAWLRKQVVKTLAAEKNDGHPGQTELPRWKLAAAVVMQCADAVGSGEHTKEQWEFVDCNAADNPGFGVKIGARS